MPESLSRWSGRLYVAVAILAPVPIWCVRYVPTVDGPSHVYNAWILHALMRGTAQAPISEWFTINWQPYPNWIGHAVMAALMFVVSPIIAEKLFLTGLVLLFLFGMWRFAGIAGDGTRGAAFIAFPFAYNRLFQYGFHNFCFGSALYFLTIAIWWRRRDRPNARTIALVAVLLVLCYFSHGMIVALCFQSVGLLWLLTIPGRRPSVHALHLLAFIPVLPLLWWFRTTGGGYLQGEARSTNVLQFLARGDVLYALDERQHVYAMAISVLIALLVIATLMRRRWEWRESDAFVILSVAIVGVYFLSVWTVPDVRDRLALFASLTTLAWLDLRLPARGQAIITLMLAFFAVLDLGYVVSRYRAIGADVERYVRSAAAIGDRSTFLPILYEIGPPHNYAPVYYHAVDYMALEKASVDVANYEPVLTYFPIALRPGMHSGNIYVANMNELNLAEEASRAEFIFAWKMPLQVRKNLNPYYTFVAGSDQGGAVFRRTPITTAPR